MKVHDRFVVPQWLASPIGRDEGKEAGLDLVPLAGPGRKMTDRNGQAGVIGEVLQLQFPQAQASAIASPAVRRNPGRDGRRPLAFSGNLTLMS